MATFIEIKDGKLVHTRGAEVTTFEFQEVAAMAGLLRDHLLQRTPPELPPLPDPQSD